MYTETGFDLYFVFVRITLRLFFKVLKFIHKLNNVKLVKKSITNKVTGNTNQSVISGKGLMSSVFPRQIKTQTVMSASFYFF